MLHGHSRNSPNWFGFVFLPSSPNWQDSGEKLTGLESQNDLMNICSGSEVRLMFRKPRDEQWNLESVKGVLVSPWELPVRTEFDAPLTRQKYITNQMLDQHGRTPLCTRCSLGTGSHSSDCRPRFEVIWTKELAEAEGYIGGLRSFDGHQDVQTNVMSSIETMSEDSAAETIDEGSHRYNYYTGELLDRSKYITGRKKNLTNWNLLV